MTNKSQVFETFQEFGAMVTAATGKTISRLTVDQERGYDSNEQTAWYRSKGIQVEPNFAYTPNKTEWPHASTGR